MKILGGMILGLALCGSVEAADVDYRIGKQGAILSLGEDWQRKVLVEGLGRDQFLSRRNICLMITELDVALKDPGDFGATLTTFVEGIKTQDPTLSATKPSFSITNGMDYAFTTFTCTVRGIMLYYEIHLVGRDGLYFMVRSWAASRDKKLLSAEMKRVLATLRMPGPRTDWGKSAVPSPITIRLDNCLLKCTVQKSIFTVKESSTGGPVCSFASKDDQVACHFFESAEARDTEAIVKSVLATLKGEFPNMKEIKREEVIVAGRKCLQATLAGKSRLDADTCVVSTLIPTEKSRFAEIRFVTTSRLEWKKPYLDSMLKTLEFSTPKKVDAFPDLVASKPGKTLTAAQLALLEASTLVAAFDAAPTHIRRLPDGSLLGAGCDRISLAKPGVTNPVPLYAPDDRSYARHAVYRDGVLWYTTGKGKLMRLKDNKAESVDCEARQVEPAGKTAMLLCRTQKPPTIPGFNPAAGSKLVLREQDGKERIVKETSSAVSHLGVDTAGKRALVASAPEWQMRTAGKAETSLAVIEIETGGERFLPPWNSVSSVIGADDCWLIQGQPAGKPAGLYRVSADGQIHLLLSGGQCNGVALTKEDLFYSTSLSTNDSENARSVLRVYRIPLAAAEKTGPGLQPFYGELIQKIAESAFAGAKLNPRASDILVTRKQLDDFFAIAQKTSRDQAGVEMPVTPAGVDDLLDDYGSHEGLRGEGELLVSVVLAECLLSQRAEWTQETPCALGMDHGVSAESRNCPFALACAPGAIVASLLHDSEGGWYEPATRVPDTAKGRPIVLCRDPDAHVAGRFGEKDRKLRQLLQGTNMVEIADFLKTQSQNVYLRELVYERLLPRQPFDNLEQLANNFVSLDTPLVDLKMILGIQSERGDKEKHAKLIQSLRAAIGRFPTEPAFYFMLGRAYERSGMADASEYARPCYKKILSLLSYGPLADKARTALARIDGKPAGTEEDDSGTDE